MGACGGGALTLTIRGLRLTSFGPFKGEHEIDLGPGAYAVVGENAVGKSVLLGAIHYVLTGRHDWPLEDNLITDGEKEGGADLELSDGTFATRTRKRKDSTTLIVRVPDGAGGERELKGDEAQATLDRIRCFSADDDVATWWVKQKKADEFVEADPAVMTRTIVGWLELEPVQKAAALVAEKLRELVDDRDQALREAEGAKEAAAAVLEGKTPEELGDERAGLLARAEVLEKQIEEQDGIVKFSEAKRAAERLVEERKGVEEDARLAREWLEANPSHLADPADHTKRQTKAQGEYGAARAETRQKRELARGEFDGTCPVGGVVCPLKDQLNADGAAARTALEVATKREGELKKTADAFAEDWRKHEQRERERSGVKAKLETYERRLVRLPIVASPTEIGKVGGIDETLQGQFDDTTRKIARIDRTLHEHGMHTKRESEKRKKADELAPEIQSWREALQILGRAGVQRRLAEGMLGDVADLANTRLSRVGADNNVHFMWARETEKLADACGQCGAPFPASRKVKVCTTCGWERGKKLDEKLRTILARRSGGADDLVGLMMKLAAAAWLRARRGSPWSVFCLDEPFAHLDPERRRALSQQLAPMLLGELGADQVFVVAHTPELASALPGRIVVTRTETGSTIRVVA